MAETQSRISSFRISVDGDWDISDLLEFSEAFADTYGLFYPILTTDEETAARLHDQLRKHFWSGDMESRYIGRKLYKQIPKSESLRLKSFHYSSPGALELVGVLSAILMMSKVAQSWIKTSDQLLALWVKIETYFVKRGKLKRPRVKTEIDETTPKDLEEATILVFEIGPMLGFDLLSCERLIAILGNPVSTLKFLVAVGREGHKLADLQKKELLHLPSADGDPITVQISGRLSPRKGPGVQVEIKKSRRVVKTAPKT